MTASLALPALTIESREAITKRGEGQVRVSFETVSGPISGQRVELFQARKDVLGNTIAGDRVSYGDTDASGSLTFNIAIGSYVVMADLRGANWGNLAAGKGQGDVLVSEGQLVLMRVRMGRIMATAALVDRALSGKRVEVRFQKRDVTGGLVMGERVTYGDTDNGGVLPIDITPGVYEVVGSASGYPWGDVFDGELSGFGTVVVRPGEETRADFRYGRLEVVGAVGSRVEVFTQRPDVSGLPITDRRVAYGDIDNSGILPIDLTAGTYVVQLGQRVLTGVSVAPSRTTRVAP